MKTIAMNDWLAEKAMIQIEAACELREIAHKAGMDIEHGSETLENRLRSIAFQVYTQACNFVGYSGGCLPEGHSPAMKAFDAGPDQMRDYATSLLRPQAQNTGWELPNPIYHSMVVPIKAPESLPNEGRGD